jgi:hypothetical protein
MASGSPSFVPGGEDPDVPQQGVFSLVYCPLHAAAPKMRRALEAIRDYEPHEVVKDDFAYDRMVDSYRVAAREAIREARGG